VLISGDVDFALPLAGKTFGCGCKIVTLSHLVALRLRKYYIVLMLPKRKVNPKLRVSEIVCVLTPVTIGFRRVLHINCAILKTYCFRLLRVRVDRDV
jgi:hypothetical protein